MAQLNINMTPTFQAELRRLMRMWDCRTKSETIRTAVHEALERAQRRHGKTDFRSLLGSAKRAPLNSHPRFEHHADVWET